MSVTLAEVRRAARAHRAPLAGESAGYLVLALADQVLSAPRLIDASDIQLTDDGGLRVLRGEASSEIDAELSLRRALDGLLLVASSGSAALMRAGRRVSPVGLPGLVRELEAALIPVNRAAARRALARLQRETARALANGGLAEEEPELRGAVPLPLASMPSVGAPASPPEIAASLPEVAANAPLAANADELQPRAVAVPVPAFVDLPPALTSLDGVLSALCEAKESELTVEASPVSDALTVALDVRPIADPAEAATILLDEDVEFIDEEPSDALTVARNIEVQPTAHGAHATGSALVDLPEEACTRPEPVILRRALRPLAEPPMPAPAPEPVLVPVVEALARTPTLGSLAAELPVLAPEQIAELTRRESEAVSLSVAASLELREPALAVEPEVRPTGPEELVVCSAPDEAFTEPMPEVAPLSAGTPIVVSRQSDVSELLAGFSVAPGDTHEGLRRAIKELAELDLTPAPFAALIR